MKALAEAKTQYEQLRSNLEERETHLEYGQSHSFSAMQAKQLGEAGTLKAYYEGVGYLREWEVLVEREEKLQEAQLPKVSPQDIPTASEPATDDEQASLAGQDALQALRAKFGGENSRKK